MDPLKLWKTNCRPNNTRWVQPNNIRRVQPNNTPQSPTPIHSSFHTRSSHERATQNPSPHPYPPPGVDRHGRRAGLPRRPLLLPRHWCPPPRLCFASTAGARPCAPPPRARPPRRLRLLVPRRGLRTGALCAHHATLLCQCPAAHGKRLHHHRRRRHRPVPGKPFRLTTAIAVFSIS